MSDTRIVLVKPGDVLVFGNVSADVDHERLADALTDLKEALGLAHILVFEDDIDLAVKPSREGFTVTEFKHPWMPHPAEDVADWLACDPGTIRDQYGDTVLVRQSIRGLEFKRPDPAPDSAEVRAEVTDILAQARP